MITEPIELTPYETADAARQLARVFRAVARKRAEARSSSSTAAMNLLGLWCTWEDVRDWFARSTADDVIRGYQHMLRTDAGAYQIAVERMDKARDRYFAAEKARRAEAAA